MTRFGKFIRSQCLADPYIQLLHCKRSLRFLQAAKAGGAHMLVLGNKYRKEIKIQDFVGKSGHAALKPTSELITNAPRNYDLILCLDPVLYARHLHNINLPCVAICKVEELYMHRDIPDAFDYIIPLGDRSESDLFDFIKKTTSTSSSSR